MLRPGCENRSVGNSPVHYAPGQQLPGTVYRVVRHLATGGMGTVYDVEDVTVGKRYVLKTLHPQLVSRDDLAKRMREEARTLAKLQHPNIVEVVTAGLTTDETRMPFYVMERLNGQNLRLVIEKMGALELAHTLRIAIDVLDALEHAHENAVIHRDVKPDNIFLHRNVNGTTVTKLLDFGIVRLLDRKVSHTQGKFLGTLRYASPEQIVGGELGPGTDIYSLGLVLYEMIAGRGPFDDVGDAFAIGAAHTQTPPPPVSRFARLVPPALERLVMAAIAKAPQGRPRDCFSFASELRRMLHDHEAAPKSATAVAVLSMAPPNTAGRALVPRDAAATLASEPGAEAKPRATALGAVAIDRFAETRAAAPGGGTQRLPSPSDTAVDLHAFKVDTGDAVGAALTQREPLEMAPACGQPQARHDIVFPTASSYVGGTGLMSGEAQTRPPERRATLPLLGAVGAFGALMLGAAVLAVTKPWAIGASATTALEAPVTVAAPATSPPPAVVAVAFSLDLARGNVLVPAAPSLAPSSSPSSSARTSVAHGGTQLPGAARSATRATVRAASPASPSDTAAPGLAPAASAGAPKKTRKGPRPAETPRPEDVGFE